MARRASRSQPDSIERDCLTDFLGGEAPLTEPTRRDSVWRQSIAGSLQIGSFAPSPEEMDDPITTSSLRRPFVPKGKKKEE